MGWSRTENIHFGHCARSLHRWIQENGFRAPKPGTILCSESAGGFRLIDPRSDRHIPSTHTVHTHAHTRTHRTHRTHTHARTHRTHTHQLLQEQHSKVNTLLRRHTTLAPNARNKNATHGHTYRQTHAQKHTLTHTHTRTHEDNLWTPHPKSCKFRFDNNFPQLSPESWIVNRVNFDEWRLCVEVSTQHCDMCRPKQFSTISQPDIVEKFLWKIVWIKEKILIDTNLHKLRNFDKGQNLSMINDLFLKRSRCWMFCLNLIPIQLDFLQTGFELRRLSCHTLCGCYPSIFESAVSMFGWNSPSHVWTWDRRRVNIQPQTNFLIYSFQNHGLNHLAKTVPVSCAQENPVSVFMRMCALCWEHFYIWTCAQIWFGRFSCAFFAHHVCWLLGSSYSLRLWCFGGCRGELGLLFLFSNRIQKQKSNTGTGGLSSQKDTRRVAPKNKKTKVRKTTTCTQSAKRQSKKIQVLAMCEAVTNSTPGRTTTQRSFTWHTQCETSQQPKHGELSGFLRGTSFLHTPRRMDYVRHHVRILLFVCLLSLGELLFPETNWLCHGKDKHRNPKSAWFRKRPVWSSLCQSFVVLSQHKHCGKIPRHSVLGNMFPRQKAQAVFGSGSVNSKWTCGWFPVLSLALHRERCVCCLVSELDAFSPVSQDQTMTVLFSDIVVQGCVFPLCWYLFVSGKCHFFTDNFYQHW